jgi:hypothetical protein
MLDANREENTMNEGIDNKEERALFDDLLKALYGGVMRETLHNTSLVFSIEEAMRNHENAANSDALAKLWGL